MKLPSFEIKCALGFTLLGLVWMAAERASGLHGEHIAKHATYTNLFAIPAIAFYVFALRAKRSLLGGSLTWTQGFASGMLITLGATVLAPLSQVITHTLISPEFFANLTGFVVAEGKMPQAQAEAYFNLKNYLVLATVGAAVMGTLTSALVALFVKRSSAKA